MFNEIERIDKIKSFRVGDYLCYLHSEKGIVCSNGFKYATEARGSLYLLNNKLFKNQRIWRFLL